MGNQLRRTSLVLAVNLIHERSVNQPRVYGTITSTDSTPTLTVGNTLRVNNFDVAVTGTLQDLADDIEAQVPNVVATVTAGLLTIAIKNIDAAVP